MSETKSITAAKQRPSKSDPIQMMFAKGGYDRKDTIDDIQDFVKNIVNDDNNRDIEVKGDKAKFISEHVNNKFWALPA